MPRSRKTRSQIDELAGSGLIDAVWYRANNPDMAASGSDPVEHFLRVGSQEGRWPNPYFDTAWYKTQNPDIAAAGLDPLIHYVRHGDLEGRRPHPAFDPAWYRHAYLARGTKALQHFLQSRDTGHFAPCGALWAVLHLPALAGFRGGDPFLAYLAIMRRQRREPFPDLPIVAESGLIDPNYYLLNAGDVHGARADPVQHYARFGWEEGRKPNLYFDLAWYTATNPDLARLRVNPIVHYILVGEPADRRPVPYFEPRWYRDTYQVPERQTALAHFLAHRRGQSVSPTRLFDAGWYAARHAEALGPHRDPFAHYLYAGTLADIDPSPQFNAAAYRKAHLGRPSRSFRRLVRPDHDNPLVHRLRTEYLAGAEPPQ